MQAIEDEGLGIVACLTNRRGCTVFLVGTAHVSKKSCALVRSTVERLEPDMVLLELCPQRASMLTMKAETAEPSTSLTQTLMRWCTQPAPRPTLFSVVFTHVQGKIAESLGVRAGQEFAEGFKSGKAVGAHVELIDRLAGRTISRLWDPLPLWRKVFCIGGVTLLPCVQFRRRLHRRN